jgi:hypothetical protein
MQEHERAARAIAGWRNVEISEPAEGWQGLQTYHRLPLARDRIQPDQGKCEAHRWSVHTLSEGLTGDRRLGY